MTNTSPLSRTDNKTTIFAEKINILNKEFLISMIDKEHNIQFYLDGCRTVEEWIQYHGYPLDHFGPEDMKEIRDDFEHRLNLEENTLIDDGFLSLYYMPYSLRRKDEQSLEEYLELQKKFDDQDVYNKAYDQFYEEHPDAPKPKQIERLSLVMKKVFAEQIISGEKKVEIRAEGPKYYGMMMDQEIIDYIERHADDELMLLKTFDFMSPTRSVKTIHFYTYNNSWSLDVECEYNWKMAVTDNNVNDLHEMYDCHEFDELLEELNAQNIPDEERPVFYCFALGNIIERRNI